MKRLQASEANLPGGVIVAAVTPRRAQEYSIDLAATLELVDFLRDGGVDGIALLGSTGEFVHFALDDRRHMLKFAAKRSRLPLLVNVSHSTLDGAVELARDAAKDGVSGVLLMPPFYFRYDQDAICGFFLKFAEELDHAVPIYLYNIPVFTNEIGIPTALQLLSTGLFAGIKDSSGSWDYFAALQASRAQCVQHPFALFVGHDGLYSKARGCGADGVISGVACALPELMAALEKAIPSGDSSRLAGLESRLSEFMNWIAHFPAPVGIKEAARLRKLKVGALAVPLGQDGCRKLAEFGEWFRAWLPEVLRECGR